MAYTSRDFLRDLAIYSTGAAVGVKNSVKFAQYAAKKGIQLAGVGVARSAPAAGRGVARLARRSPAGFGAGLGLGLLETAPGEALLEMAAERGAADRRALEQAIDERIFRATRVAEDPFVRQSVKSTVKRKASKYSKAVKAGMTAVKKSKFDGKRGTIKNPKKTFSTVNKVVSAVNKGKKVATKGVRGTIARAARRVFK
jgi:hypothetical protein